MHSESDMGDTTYHMLRALGYPFAYRVVGYEHILPGLPAVYVANHLASTGPIQVVLSMPIRFRPWVIAEMADITRAQEYLYADFILPAWHLTGRLGTLVTRVVARIAVALIHTLDGIPVDRSRGRYLEAFRSSISHLTRGHNLLIFPEDPSGPLDPVTQLRPFMFGFIYLCYLYRRETGKDLPMYPLAVIPSRRRVVVGPPLYFKSEGHARSDILNMRDQLQARIQALYLSSVDNSG
jgi:hypothetical protein